MITPSLAVTTHLHVSDQLSVISNISGSAINCRPAANVLVNNNVFIRERKQDIIASEFGEVLEILEPRFGFKSIGGLEHVKRFFRDSVIKPMRAGNLNRVPMGVLLTGPAGTGKTAVAEAVAFEARVMCRIAQPGSGDLPPK